MSYHTEREIAIAPSLLRRGCAYYEIRVPGSPRPVLKAQVGAQVDHRTPRLADLADPPRFGFRGCSSEPTYYRESRQRLFLGDVTSRQFLTLLHLTPEALQVDSTGVSVTKRNLAKEDLVQ